MAIHARSDRPSALVPPGDELRRGRILDAGLAVFVRFGFRKASMDEIARAAGISRQGLYLHFATKEALFQAVIEHALGTAADDAARALAHEGGLEDALVGALDAWMGRFVAMVTKDATDLHDAVERFAGARIRSCEDELVDGLARRLRASGLAAHYRAAGLSARELAENLYATARGAKHAAETRDDLVTRLRVAARALCLPLRLSSRRGPAR